MTGRSALNEETHMPLVDLNRILRAKYDTTKEADNVPRGRMTIGATIEAKPNGGGKYYKVLLTDKGGAPDANGVWNHAFDAVDDHGTLTDSSHVRIVLQFVRGAHDTGQDEVVKINTNTTQYDVQSQQEPDFWECRSELL